MRKWKHLTALVLAAVVLLPTAQAAHTHPEVPVKKDPNICSFWAEEGVKQAIGKGLWFNVVIDKDLTVPTTRNEFRGAAMSYVRLNQSQRFLDELVEYYWAEKDEEGNMKLVFQDKPEENDSFWGTDRANSIAYYLGLVEGRSPGYFAPDEPITRQEAAVMLARAYQVLGKELPEETEELPFTDANEIADWARDSVAVLYTWDVLQGREDSSFDPQGPFTREQCLITFLRLYENAPVSRKNGNVEPMFTYDQVMNMLENHYYGDDMPYGFEARWDGPTATLIRQFRQAPLVRPTTTFFVYRDGSTKFFDIGLCKDYGPYGAELTPSVRFRDGAFSPDGSTFTCTVVLDTDGVVWVPDSNGEAVVVHPAGVYHVTVDVETLEVTHEWEPLPV